MEPFVFELPGLVFGPIVLRSTWWGFEVISLALEEMTNKSMENQNASHPSSNVQNAMKEFYYIRGFINQSKRTNLTYNDT